MNTEMSQECGADCESDAVTDFTSPARVQIQPKINLVSKESFSLVHNGGDSKSCNKPITYRFDQGGYKVLCKFARRNTVQCLF